MAPAQTIWPNVELYVAAVCLRRESVIEIENRLAALWKRFAVLRFCLPINPSTFSWLATIVANATLFCIFTPNSLHFFSSSVSSISLISWIISISSVSSIFTILSILSILLIIRVWSNAQFLIDSDRFLIDFGRFLIDFG